MRNAVTSRRILRRRMCTSSELGIAHTLWQARMNGTQLKPYDTDLSIAKGYQIQETMINTHASSAGLTLSG